MKIKRQRLIFRCSGIIIACKKLWGCDIINKKQRGTNIVEINEENTKRVKIEKDCRTINLIEDWYSNTVKKFLIIRDVITCFSEKICAYLNIIISREDSIPTEDRGERPYFTMSYLKRKYPFHIMQDFCFDGYESEKRERFLLKAIHKVLQQIEKSDKGDIVTFELPVSLYSQCEWDRKKGTFDGWGYYGPAQKLYGEMSFELLIRGVEIEMVRKK